MSSRTWTQTNQQDMNEALTAEFESMEFCNRTPHKSVVNGVSWTKYLGRRYVGCGDYRKDEPNLGCNYFRWVDEPLAPHIENIISSLLRKKIDAEHVVGQTELKLMELRDEIRSLLKLTTKREVIAGDKRLRAENEAQLEELNSVLAKNDTLIAENTLLKNRLGQMEFCLLILFVVFATFVWMLI